MMTAVKTTSKTTGSMPCGSICCTGHTCELSDAWGCWRDNVGICFKEASFGNRAAKNIIGPRKIKCSLDDLLLAAFLSIFISSTFRIKVRIEMVNFNCTSGVPTPIPETWFELPKYLMALQWNLVDTISLNTFFGIICSSFSLTGLLNWKFPVTKITL